MNRRLKDLAKAAGLKQTKWADVETGVEPVRIWQESLNDPGALERFAKLIVADCAAMTRNLSPQGEFAERAVLEDFGFSKDD